MHTSKKKRKRRSRINRTHIKESSIELESFWWEGPTELTLGSSIHYYNYISSFTKDFVSFLSYCMYILYKTRVLVCSLKCIFYLDSYFLWKMWTWVATKGRFLMCSYLGSRFLLFISLLQNSESCRWRNNMLINTAKMKMLNQMFVHTRKD